MNARLRFVLLSVLACIIVFVAIGCTGETVSPPDGSAEPAATNEDGEAGTDAGEGLPEPGNFSKPLELTLSGSFTRGKAVDGSWVQKKLEEMFNVKINNVKVDTYNKDQAQLLIASGDMPDTWAFTASTLTPLEFYENGLSRTISKEMLQKYAPLYSKTVDENPPGWDMFLAPGTDNEYLKLSGYYGHTVGLGWAPTFRLDWLEKLGIEPPGEIKPVGPEGGRERIFFTDQAYTIEEIEEIFRAFTQDDPDGNGVDDTYAMIPFNDSWSWWTSTLMGAYGIAQGFNLMEDEKLVTTEISANYKEFLKLLAKWYKEGMIDPEWTTLDRNKAYEKYKLGKIGYTQAQPAYIGMDVWTTGRMPQNLVVHDPNVKVLVTAPPIGPSGHQGDSAPVHALSDSFYVSKDVTDEELARILQIFDYLNFDDASRWAIYGEIGTHSDWEGTPEQSAIIVKPEFNENGGDTASEGELGFWAYHFRTYDMKRVQYITSEYTMNLKRDFFANPEVLEKMAIRPYKWDLMNETNLQEVQKTYGARLDTIVQEFRTKAVVGEIDVDQEWDAYIQNWMNNGGKELLAELEKAPLVSDLLQAK